MSVCFVSLRCLERDVDHVTASRRSRKSNSILVFKSTRNNAHRGHVTDTQRKPDFTAAFDKHWGDKNTTLWPCIRLAGEAASAGKSKEQQKKQAISMCAGITE